MACGNNECPGLVTQAVVIRFALFAGVVAGSVRSICHGNHGPNAYPDIGFPVVQPSQFNSLSPVLGQRR